MSPKAVPPRPRSVTADELLQLSTGTGRRYELVAGELRTMSPASFHHGVVANAISLVLSEFVRAHQLGFVLAAETGFVISTDPDTVRAPDVSFVSHARIEEFGRPPRGYFPAAPDLAIEVLSPDERTEEVDEKIEDWFEGGAHSVWIANPRRKTVTVYHSPVEGQMFSIHHVLSDEAVLPGFQATVAEFFPF